MYINSAKTRVKCTYQHCSEQCHQQRFSAARPLAHTFAVNNKQTNDINKSLLAYNECTISVQSVTTIINLNIRTKVTFMCK